MTGSDSKAIILIPTYNEAKNLPILVREIRSHVPADILFIDDDSPDGTAQTARRLSQEYGGIHLLNGTKKKGIGDAYKRGFEWALTGDYEFFLMMDADLSHDPSVLPLFLEKIRHCDAVFASRYVDGGNTRNWSFTRLLFSRFSNYFINALLGVGHKSTDTTTAYKCFRKEALQQIGIGSLRGKKNAFLIDLVYQTIANGLSTAEIPFTFSGRRLGVSKSHAAIVAESTALIFILCLDRIQKSLMGKSAGGRPKKN